MPNGMILRQNLTSIFDSFSDERIIYVYAPAGYGKTVAVSQWLDGITRAKASISIDEYDNNPANFCERLCTALKRCQPRNAVLAEIVSHPAFGSAPDEFAIRAIASLSERKRAVLVIDDLHSLRDERVLHLLLIFLKRLPKTFQIVLISRNGLPSVLSDLWIDGRLTRVAAQQLRFNSEEIMSLYKKRGNPITLEKAEDIYKFTDGWAIGINAMLLSGGEPLGESLDYLEVYIRSNIWKRWSENTREFMLRTAAARELTPSLCTALTGVADSEKLLNRLIRGGAFISKTQNGVYHYHQLFKSFLKKILEERGDEYLFPLMEKEGQWYFLQQDFFGAVECFIRCGDHEGIAKCFMMFSSNGYYYHIIERILPIANDPEVIAAADRYPFMFSPMSWAALVEGRIGDMTAYIDQYYARNPEIIAMEPTNAHIIFHVHMLDYRFPIRDLINAVAALPCTPNPKNATSPITMNILMLHRNIRDFSELAGEDTEANTARAYDIIGWMYGEEARLLAESLMAGLLYEQGHLEKAHIHALAANAEIKKHFVPGVKCCALVVLIYVLDALGQQNEAESILKRLTVMIEQGRAYYLSHNINALTARRKLAKGDMKAAWNWLTEHNTALYDDLKFYDVYRAFTTCRAYITIGDYDSAIILLSKLLVPFQAFNRPMDIIETEILLSIAYWKKKRGFQEKAMVYLEDAVRTAYGFGYTQLFVNEGAELAGMMHRLQKRAQQQNDENKAPVSFIKMLYLKILENKNSGLTSEQPVKSVRYTDKQKTVMTLLCEGKSNKEIAEIMGIKITTLRSHIQLIYKKLDVTSERDAIMKIKELGLFEEM